jgi:hypothetical protein
MSQVDEYKIPASPLQMTELAAVLEAMFAAVASSNRGATAPDSPFEGMLWWDTSGNPTEVLKRYTVTAGWVSLISVNITTGVFSFVGESKVTLTAAGDLPYASAANTLARLAKAASGNYKLFQNAGLTAPEWAKGIVRTSHTFDLSSSGVQTLTGAGFTPAMAIAIFGKSGTTCGIGLSDGSNGKTIIPFYGSTLYGSLNSHFIEVYVDGANYQIGTLSFNGDGGPINWAKTGSPTGTLYFDVIWFR